MNFPELTEVELEFLERAGMDPDNECCVLSTRITMYGIAPAMMYDPEWFIRLARENKRLEAQPDLVRLKALYVWMLANPPKTS